MYSRGMVQRRSSKEAAPLRQLEEGDHDPAHLAGHRGAHLALVHDPRGHEGLAEAPLAVAFHEGGDQGELLVGDPAEGEQGLAQAVFLEVARGEDQAAVVEERGLDQLARAHLEVAALALDGEAADGVADGSPGQFDEHGVT